MSAKSTDAIVRAYAESKPFATLEYEHAQRGPFLFFLEKGSQGLVREFSEQQRPAISHLVEVFAKRIGAGLGRARAERPLVVWLVGEASYRACGGDAHSSARFDRDRQHVVVRSGATSSKAERELLRALGRQLLDAWRDPRVPLGRGEVSPWLSYGLAAYLASVPPQAELREERDPGFRFLDERRIRALARLCWKPLHWGAEKAIDPEHHPLRVVSYATLAGYMRATRAHPDFDYGTQLLDYEDSAHAAVAFLDVALREHFRDKLLALLKLEFSGTHGIAAFDRVFPKSERARLQALFDMFLWYPSAVAGAPYPEDVDKWVKLFAGGTMFDDGAEAWSIADAGVEPLGASERGDAALAQAMGALRRLDVEGARAALGERADGPARELLADVSELERVLRGFERATRGKRAVAMYVPPENRRWRVRSLDRERGSLVLERGGEKRQLALRDVPAHRILQSLKIARQPALTKKTRALFGLLAALQGLAMPAEGRERFAKECSKHGITLASERVRAFEAQLRVLAAFDTARAALATNGVIGDSLDELASRLGELRGDARVLPSIAERAEALLARATDKPDGWPSMLGGKSELLPGGRLRITYDWSDPAQAEDWVAVTKADGFAPAHRPFAFGAKLELDGKKGQARLTGGALRHRVQFLGDASIRFGLTSTAASATTIQPRDPGRFWLAALRPCTFVGGGATLLEACFQQRVIGQKRVPGAAVIEQFQRDGHCTIRLQGKMLEILAGKKSCASLTVPVVRGHGAVLWSPVGKPAEARVGTLVLEGTPHPRSVALAKGRFLKSWWRRLRGSASGREASPARAIRFEGDERRFRAQVTARYDADPKDPWALVGLTELEGSSEKAAERAKALAHCDAFLALPRDVMAGIASERPAIRREMARYRQRLADGERLWVLASASELRFAARRTAREAPSASAQRRAVAISDARKAQVFAQRRLRRSSSGAKPERMGKFDKQIERGLAWLSAEQGADGSWDAPRATAKVAVTALALLALLADGATPTDGPRADSVRRAIMYLQGQQDGSGRLGAGVARSSVYTHAIASLALLEAWHRAPSPELSAACERAIEYALKIRNPYKVWRYYPRDGASDTSVTSWMCVMLACARKRGFSVPERPLEFVKTWFREVTDPSNGEVGYSRRGERSSQYEDEGGVFTPIAALENDCLTLTAAGLTCGSVLGRVRTELDALAAKVLLARLPSRSDANYLYWHWGTTAMSHLGDDVWRKWSKAIASALPALQDRSGAFAAKGRWCGAGGKPFATALAVMALLACDGRNLTAAPMLVTR